MYISLLTAGIVVALGGIATVGFGIPINAFSLGNTLILAGTTAFVGGMLLVGLAFAVRQLKRIANALQPIERARARAASQAGSRRPASSAPARAGQPRPPQAGMPTPPVPVPVPMPTPAMPDVSRQEAAHPSALADDRSEPAAGTGETRGPAAAPSAPRPPLDWLRSRANASEPAKAGAAKDGVSKTDEVSKAGAISEPPVVDLDDEAPLSPRAPAQPSLSPLASLALPPEDDARAFRPGVGEETGIATGEEAAAGPERVARAERREPRLFEAAWPGVRRDRTRDTVIPMDDMLADRPIPDEELEAKIAEALAETVGDRNEAGSTPVAGQPDAPGAAAVEQQAPTDETMASADREDDDMQDSSVTAASDSETIEVAEVEVSQTVAIEETGSEPVPAQDEPAGSTLQQRELAAERPVAVLKSGVIDGMAYTLYADGSIEADLPQQGTMRFGSVEALRDHLERV